MVQQSEAPMTMEVVAEDSDSSTSTVTELASLSHLTSSPAVILPQKFFLYEKSLDVRSPISAPPRDLFTSIGSTLPHRQTQIPTVWILSLHPGGLGRSPERRFEPSS